MSTTIIEQLRISIDGQPALVSCRAEALRSRAEIAAAIAGAFGKAGAQREKALRAAGIRGGVVQWIDVDDD